MKFNKVDQEFRKFLKSKLSKRTHYTLHNDLYGDDNNYIGPDLMELLNTTGETVIDVGDFMVLILADFQPYQMHNDSGKTFVVEARRITSIL